MNSKLNLRQRAALLVLAMFCSLTGTWAQNELTVYDSGTATNKYVPAYVFYFDDFTKSQFVIPSSELTSMNGGTISSIKFYTTSYNVPYTTVSTVDVYLKEVTYTSISAYEAKADCSTVYQGTLDIVSASGGGELTITFATPFTYRGGNLLIGIENTTAAGYKEIFFYGQTVSNASVAGYNGSSLDEVPATQQNFIPQTTFTYTDGTAVLAKPTNIEVYSLLTNSASIYWDLPTGATGSVYQYKKASETVWSAEVSPEYPSITLSGLEPATAYNFRVKALYGSDASGWAVVDFTTDCNPVTGYPWYENFNGYSDGAFNDLCWRNEHIEGSSTSVFNVYSSPDYDNDTKMLCLPDQGVGNKTMLVLPQMYLGEGGVNYMFSLDIYRNDAFSDRTEEGIRVYASTDGKLEGATELAFIPRLYMLSNVVIPEEQESGWYTYDLMIPFTSGSCYIILVGESEYGSATYMDNFRVDMAPNCMRTTGLRASLYPNAEVSVDWKNNGADAWQLCIDGNTNYIMCTNNGYYFSSLTPDVVHSVKVRSYCSATSQGLWSKTIYFEPTNKQIIGSGSYTDDSFPTDCKYINSLTQQIYTVEELGQAGAIESIAFKNTSGAAHTRHLDIYMVSTEKSSFNSKNDWVPVTSADRVYSGDVNFAAGVWTTITLDTPFPYEGTENMALVIDDHTLSDDFVATEFLTFYVANKQGLYVSDDGTNFDPTQPSGYSGTIQYFKNQIRVAKGAAPAVLRPTELAVSDIMGRYATLSWKENGTATQWQIAFVDDEDTFTRIITADTNPYTLTGLTPETTYNVRVRALKGSGESLWSHKLTFTTPIASPVPTGIVADNITYCSADISWTGNPEATNYDLRYGCQIYSDFNDFSLGKWTTIDADGDGYNWVLGSAVGAIYLTGYSALKNQGHNGSADFVTSGSYVNVTSTPLTPDNYLVSPYVALGGTITFWACAQDDNYPTEHFGVAVSTTSKTDASAFNTIWENDMTAAPALRAVKKAAPRGSHRTQGNWYQYTVDLSDYAGQYGYVAIRHFDSNDMFMLNVDDIVITEPESRWSTIENISGNSQEITGLEPLTSYFVQVRANFMTDASSEWAETTFTTTDIDNPKPSDFDTYVFADGFSTQWNGSGDTYDFHYRTASDLSAPTFFDDFENGFGQWTALQGDCSQIVPGQSECWYFMDPTSELSFEAHSGSQVVSSWSSASSNPLHANNYLVSPPLVFGQTLKFWVRTDAERPDAYEVLLSTTGNAIADFVHVWKPLVKAPATGDWTEVTIDLSAYAGRQGYIAIHHQDYNGNYLMIDDFGIYNAGEWSNIETLTGPGIGLGGLATNTAYEFQVRSTKNGMWSWWSDMQTVALLTLQDDVDNTSLIRNNTGRLAHVTLAGRTLKRDGKYNVLCLPFDMKIAECLPPNATVKQVSNMEYNSTTKILTVTFGESLSGSTVIPAGTPFIVKWSEGEDLTNLKFANVIVGSGTPGRVSCSGGTFKGNFAPWTLYESGNKQMYFGSDKPLSWPAINISIGAFRAYLNMPAGVAKGNGIIIDFGDGTQISVSSLKGDANGDGSVSITDAVGVVNYILGSPSGNFNWAAANVNDDIDTSGNPNISITDAVGIVNIILNSGNSTAPELDAPEDVEADEVETGVEPE
jgi:hypothetical protein